MKALREKEFDVLVIGGGATGAGCVLDAQTRGLSAALVERGDFSSGDLNVIQLYKQCYNVESYYYFRFVISITTVVILLSMMEAGVHVVEHMFHRSFVQYH